MPHFGACPILQRLLLDVVVDLLERGPLCGLELLLWGEALDVPLQEVDGCARLLQAGMRQEALESPDARQGKQPQLADANLPLQLPQQGSRITVGSRLFLHFRAHSLAEL